MTNQEIEIELENIRRMAGIIAGGVRNKSNYGYRPVRMTRQEMMTEARDIVRRAELLLRNIRQVENE